MARNLVFNIFLCCALAASWAEEGRALQQQTIRLISTVSPTDELKKSITAGTIDLKDMKKEIRSYQMEFRGVLFFQVVGGKELRCHEDSTTFRQRACEGSFYLDLSKGDELGFSFQAPKHYDIRTNISSPGKTVSFELYASAPCKGEPNENSVLLVPGTDFQPFFKESGEAQVVGNYDAHASFVKIGRASTYLGPPLCFLHTRVQLASPSLEIQFREVGWVASYNRSAAPVPSGGVKYGYVGKTQSDPSIYCGIAARSSGNAVDTAVFTIFNLDAVYKLGDSLLSAQSYTLILMAACAAILCCLAAIGAFIKAAVNRHWKYVDKLDEESFDIKMTMHAMQRQNKKLETAIAMNKMEKAVATVVPDIVDQSAARTIV